MYTDTSSPRSRGASPCSKQSHHESRPGTATADLVGAFFALDDLGTFTVKGVSEPLRVFELCSLSAIRTRFGLSQVRGRSDFVGRPASS